MTTQNSQIVTLSFDVIKSFKKEYDELSFFESFNLEVFDTVNYLIINCNYKGFDKMCSENTPSVPIEYFKLNRTVYKTIFKDIDFYINFIKKHQKSECFGESQNTFSMDFIVLKDINAYFEKLRQIKAFILESFSDREIERLENDRNTFFSEHIAKSKSKHS